MDVEGFDIAGSCRQEVRACRVTISMFSWARSRIQPAMDSNLPCLTLRVSRPSFAEDSNRLLGNRTKN